MCVDELDDTIISISIKAEINMIRQIIKIDEEKCNGCGLCIPDCPEGALQLIDGKARLVSDLFCDGLGACIGNCPEGAISVEEREAEAYDEALVMETIIKQGNGVIKAHLKHLADHGERGYLNIAIQCLKERGISIPEYEEKKSMCASGGCPGTASRELKRPEPEDNPHAPSAAILRSELANWPVQLKLINPYAEYFKNAHLLIAADCTPFAYANFHSDFVRDKISITFCPKLDPYIEEYIEKLSELFRSNNIRSVTAVRMEVPCCGGVKMLIEKALEKSEKKIPLYEHIISIKGERL